MECDFEIRYVPCPPEREADYRIAIKLIAKLIRAELDQAPQSAQLETVSPASVANIHGGERKIS